MENRRRGRFPGATGDRGTSQCPATSISRRPPARATTAQKKRPNLRVWRRQARKRAPPEAAPQRPRARADAAVAGFARTSRNAQSVLSPHRDRTTVLLVGTYCTG